VSLNSCSIPEFYIWFSQRWQRSLQVEYKGRPWDNFTSSGGGQPLPRDHLVFKVGERYYTTLQTDQTFWSRHMAGLFMGTSPWCSDGSTVVIWTCAYLWMARWNMCRVGPSPPAADQPDKRISPIRQFVGCFSSMQREDRWPWWALAEKQDITSKNPKKVKRPGKLRVGTMLRKWDEIQRNWQPITG
jgi:hypothetical protein